MNNRGLAKMLAQRTAPTADARNKTSKLFVYGIFLGEEMRKRYNLRNPKYATVKGYMTVGGYIVHAIPVDSDEIALTGLICDVDDWTGLRNNWEKLDDLESNYDRVKVTTVSGEDCWMYTAIEKGNK